MHRFEDHQPLATMKNIKVPYSEEEAIVTPLDRHTTYRLKVKSTNIPKIFRINHIGFAIDEKDGFNTIGADIELIIDGKSTTFNTSSKTKRA